MKLQRGLNKWHGYALMIGGMVGSGIFVVTGEAGAQAGPSVPLGYIVLLPILLASALGYLVYLSTPLGNSPGGAYIHISRTFKNYFVGFIFMWFQYIALLGVMTVMSISFGEFVASLLDFDHPLLIGTALLLFFFFLNVTGVKWFGKIQLLMTAILFVAILFLVIPGLFFIEFNHYKPMFPFGLEGFLSILPSLFFAYFGFEQLAQAGGEMKNAQKELPKTMIRGSILTMVIYFLVSFVAFGVLPYQQLAATQTAMSDVASTYLPSYGTWIVNIGILMAFATTLNSLMMVVSRILFTFADDRIIPPVLAKVSERTGTPNLALVINVVIVLILLWTNTMNFVMMIALQGMFLMYIGHSIALIALPYKNPELFAQAQFKPSKGLILICGLFAISTLLFFSYKMLLSVGDVLIVWTVVGAVVYALGKRSGKKANFDYEKKLSL
ncbi:APC family permease [Bacillus suaedaesalsae]|uniref:Amino acid permease n=1 Tax=Bacillus suaedaesalsae TaxID=2810349 RepID=A0ABS2DGW6_9BACI|nr:APC family permease [Bacillus suaedaesalsae]MBM6617721.1 amino acid permease [Bacillus suaedaesalsae]